MYAIIRAGGKQAKVRSGDVIEVERIKSGEDQVEFRPLLVVDDDGNTVTAPQALADATVTARILGEVKGDKIDIFKYKNKTGYRRQMGHRQTYTQLEITGIDLKKKATAKRSAAKSSDKESDKKSAEEPAPEVAKPTAEPTAEKSPKARSSSGKSTSAKSASGKSTSAKSTSASSTDSKKTSTKSSSAKAETGPAKTSRTKKAADKEAASSEEE